MEPLEVGDMAATYGDMEPLFEETLAEGNPPLFEHGITSITSEADPALPDLEPLLNGTAVSVQSDQDLNSLLYDDASNPVPVHTEEYPEQTPREDDVHTEEMADNNGQSDDNSDDDKEPLSLELEEGYRILRQLMSTSCKSINWPFMDPVDEESVPDYYEKVSKPMWMAKMKEKFQQREYTSITEFAADMRLMLENCYRYNGPDHTISKRAQKLEMVLEQKFALLSRDLREKTSIAATSGRPIEEIQISGTRRRKNLTPHDSSALLNQLRQEEQDREKEKRRQQILERKQQQEAFMQDLNEWVEKMMEAEGTSKVKVNAMWEIPQIGHFLFLCSDVLNLGEVIHWELEHCFLMPRESTTMQRIMTSLLSTPYQRTRLDGKPLMPYKVWEEKLRLRLRFFYKILKDRGKDITKACSKLGLEERFFHVVGMKNPLEKKKYHELTVYQRVWIMKGLCDYCLEHHESIRDSIETQDLTEQREYCLGNDTEGNTYMHFPQFCGADLRIYKQAPAPVPKLDKPVTTCDYDFSHLYSPKKRKQKSVKKKSKKKKKTKEPTPAATPKPTTPTSRPSRLRQNPRQIQQQALCDLSTSEESGISSGSDSDTESSRSSIVKPRQPLWMQQTWYQDFLQNRCDTSEQSDISRASTPLTTPVHKKSTRGRVSQLRNDDITDTSRESSPLRNFPFKSFRGNQRVKRKIGAEELDQMNDNESVCSSKSSFDVRKTDQNVLNDGASTSTLDRDEDNVSVNQDPDEQTDGNVENQSKPRSRTPRKRRSGAYYSRRKQPRKRAANKSSAKGDPDDDKTKDNVETRPGMQNESDCDNVGGSTGLRGHSVLSGVDNQNKMDVDDSNQGPGDALSSIAMETCDSVEMNMSDKKCDEKSEMNAKNDTPELLNKGDSISETVRCMGASQTCGDHGNNLNATGDSGQNIMSQPSAKYGTENNLSGSGDHKVTVDGRSVTHSGPDHKQHVSSLCKSSASCVEQKGDAVTSKTETCSTETVNSTKSFTEVLGSTDTENVSNNLSLGGVDYKTQSGPGDQFAQKSVNTNLNYSSPSTKSEPGSLTNNSEGPKSENPLNTAVKTEVTHATDTKILMDMKKEAECDKAMNTNMQVDVKTELGTEAGDNKSQRDLKKEQDINEADETKTLMDVKKEPEANCGESEHQKNMEMDTKSVGLLDSKADIKVKTEMDLTDTKTDCKSDLNTEEKMQTDCASSEVEMKEVSGDNSEKPEVRAGEEVREARPDEDDEETEAAEESSEDEWVELHPDIKAFELVVDTVESLRQLTSQFAEQEPIITGTGKKQKVIKPPPRKKCVIELYERMAYLLKELEPWEQKLMAANKRAKIKMKKEKEEYVPEPDKEEEVEDVWESEEPQSESSGDSDDSTPYQDDSQDEDFKSSARSKSTPSKTKPQSVEKETGAAENIEDIEKESMGVSSWGRIRKRRVIPNNIEDQGLPKKVPKPAPKEKSPAPNILSASKAKNPKANSQLVSHLQGPPTSGTGLPAGIQPNQAILINQPGGGQAIVFANQLMQNPALLAHLTRGNVQHVTVSVSGSQKQPVIKALLSTPVKTAAASQANPNTSKQQEGQKFPPFRFAADPNKKPKPTLVTAPQQGALHTGTVTTPSTVSVRPSVKTVDSNNGKSGAKMEVSNMVKTNQAATASKPCGSQSSPLINVNALHNLPPAVIQALLRQQASQGKLTPQQVETLSQQLLGRPAAKPAAAATPPVSSTAVAPATAAEPVIQTFKSPSKPNTGQTTVGTSQTAVSVVVSPVRPSVASVNKPAGLITSLGQVAGGQVEKSGTQTPLAQQQVVAGKLAGVTLPPPVLAAIQQQAQHGKINLQGILQSYADLPMGAALTTKPRYATNVTVKSLLESRAAKHKGADIVTEPSSASQPLGAKSPVYTCISTASVITSAAPATEVQQQKSPVSPVAGLIVKPVGQPVSSSAGQAAVQPVSPVNSAQRIKIPVSQLRNPTLQAKVAAKLAQVAQSPIIEKAVKSVITTAPTTLPTMQMKVSSPFSLPTQQPRKSVTLTTAAMKKPIAATLSPQSESDTNPTARGSSVSVASSNAALAVTPSGQKIDVTSVARNMSALVPDAEKQDGSGVPNSLMQVKVGMQSLMTSKGLVQGVVLPPSVVVPQHMLQQQVQAALNKPVAVAQSGAVRKLVIPDSKKAPVLSVSTNNTGAAPAVPGIVDTSIMQAGSSSIQHAALGSQTLKVSTEVQSKSTETANRANLQLPQKVAPTYQGFTLVKKDPAVRPAVGSPAKVGIQVTVTAASTATAVCQATGQIFISNTGDYTQDKNHCGTLPVQNIVANRTIMSPRIITGPVRKPAIVSKSVQMTANTCVNTVSQAVLRQVPAQIGATRIMLNQGQVLAAPVAGVIPQTVRVAAPASGVVPQAVRVAAPASGVVAQAVRVAAPASGVVPQAVRVGGGNFSIQGLIMPGQNIIVRPGQQMAVQGVPQQQQVAIIQGLPTSVVQGSNQQQIVKQACRVQQGAVQVAAAQQPTVAQTVHVQHSNIGAVIKPQVAAPVQQKPISPAVLKSPHAVLKSPTKSVQLVSPTKMINRVLPNQLAVSEGVKGQSAGQVVPGGMQDMKLVQIAPTASRGMGSEQQIIKGLDAAAVQPVHIKPASTPVKAQPSGELEQSSTAVVESLKVQNAANIGPLKVAANTGIIPQQRLLLYSINGQLVTGQGIPVTLDGGVLKPDPNSKLNISALQAAKLLPGASAEQKVITAPTSQPQAVTGASNPQQHQGVTVAATAEGMRQQRVSSVQQDHAGRVVSSTQMISQTATVQAVSNRTSVNIEVKPTALQPQGINVGKVVNTQAAHGNKSSTVSSLGSTGPNVASHQITPRSVQSGGVVFSVNNMQIAGATGTVHTNPSGGSTVVFQSQNHIPNESSTSNGTQKPVMSSADDTQTSSGELDAAAALAMLYNANIQANK